MVYSFNYKELSFLKMSEIKEYRGFLKKHNIISKNNSQKIKLKKGQDRLAFSFWLALIKPENEIEALQNFANLRKSVKQDLLDLKGLSEPNRNSFN